MSKHREIKEVDVITVFGRCNDTEGDDTYKTKKLLLGDVLYELTGPACCIKQAIKIIKSDLPILTKHWHWNGIHFFKSYPITGKLETKFEFYPTIILRKIFKKHKPYKEAPLMNDPTLNESFVYQILNINIT